MQSPAYYTCKQSEIVPCNPLAFPTFAPRAQTRFFYALLKSIIKIGISK